MKKTSEQKVADILALLQQGVSIREVARRVPVSKSLVSKIRQKHSITTKTSKGGRPPKLSVQTKRLIVRKITSGECDTATEAQKILKNVQGINVHANTVRNALRKAGKKGAIKQKKPLLSARHTRLRLEFARKYKDWTLDDWKRVIWSDETKINRFGSDGRKWCWKKPGTSLKSNHVDQTIKFRGGSLMIWGCMTAHWVGYACKI